MAALPIRRPLVTSPAEKRNPGRTDPDRTEASDKAAIASEPAGNGKPQTSSASDEGGASVGNGDVAPVPAGSDTEPNTGGEDPADAGGRDPDIGFGNGDVAGDDPGDSFEGSGIDVNDGSTGGEALGPPTTIDFGIGAPSAARVASERVPQPTLEPRTIDVPRLDLEPEEQPGGPGLPPSPDPGADDVLFDRVSSTDTDDFELDDDPIDDGGDQVLLDAFD